MAGAAEYSHTFFKLYTDKIGEHFGPYLDHEAVEFAKRIRAENGIGYDAVASMAVHLDDNLDLRTDVAAGSLEGGGKRWTGSVLSNF